MQTRRANQPSVLPGAARDPSVAAEDAARGEGSAGRRPAIPKVQFFLINLFDNDLPRVLRCVTELGSVSEIEGGVSARGFTTLLLKLHLAKRANVVDKFLKDKRIFYPINPDGDYEYVKTASKGEDLKDSVEYRHGIELWKNAGCERYCHVIFESQEKQSKPINKRPQVMACVCAFFVLHFVWRHCGTVTW